MGIFTHLTHLYGLPWLIKQILQMFSILVWPFTIHDTLVFLTTRDHDVLIIVSGRGTLAKAKEGQREEFQVKRESLPTSTSGGVIPSRHSRTCTYLYGLRQGGSYTKWPSMSYLNKEFCSMV